MAPVLPRRLAPVLPTTYSPNYLHLAKAQVKLEHSGSPHHAFAHCGVFAPAAPRGARASVSVPFSGLPLSRPLPIFGLVVRYTANYLIGRRLILRPYVSGMARSSLHSLSGVVLSFPRLSLTKGQIIDVLLSIPLGYCYP